MTNQLDGYGEEVRAAAAVFATLAQTIGMSQVVAAEAMLMLSVAMIYQMTQKHPELTSQEAIDKLSTDVRRIWMNLEEITSSATTLNVVGHA